MLIQAVARLALEQDGIARLVGCRQVVLAKYPCALARNGLGG